MYFYLYGGRKCPPFPLLPGSNLSTYKPPTDYDEGLQALVPALRWDRYRKQDKVPSAYVCLWVKINCFYGSSDFVSAAGSAFPFDRSPNAFLMAARSATRPRTIISHKHGPRRVPSSTISCMLIRGITLVSSIGAREKRITGPTSLEAGVASAGGGYCLRPSQFLQSSFPRSRRTRKTITTIDLKRGGF